MIKKEYKMTEPESYLYLGLLEIGMNENKIKWKYIGFENNSYIFNGVYQKYDDCSLYVTVSYNLYNEFEMDIMNAVGGYYKFYSYDTPIVKDFYDSATTNFYKNFDNNMSSNDEIKYDTYEHYNEPFEFKLNVDYNFEVLGK